MVKDPQELLKLFWSAALGVNQESITNGNLTFSSTGLYRQNRENLIFLFEHLDSSSLIINTSANQKSRLEEVVRKSYSEFEAILSNEFTLEFDDYDFYLPIKKDSFKVSAPYYVTQMSDEHKNHLELFLKSCTEDEVDILDLSDDTLNEHIVLVWCEEKIVGAGRYYVIPRTESLADITLITSVEHRNKGIAKTILSDLLDLIVRLELTPRYRVKTDNYSSIKVAESFGFKKFNRIRTYSV